MLLSPPSPHLLFQITLLDAAHSLVLHGLVRPPPRYEAGGGVLLRRSMRRYRALFGGSRRGAGAGATGAMEAAALEREIDSGVRREHFAVQRRLFLGALRLQEAAIADAARSATEHAASAAAAAATTTLGGGTLASERHLRRSARRRHEVKRQRRQLLRLGGGGDDVGGGGVRAAKVPFTLKLCIESASWREGGGASCAGDADAVDGGDSGFVCFVVRVDFAGLWHGLGSANAADGDVAEVELSWRVETRYSALDKLRWVGAFMLREDANDCELLTLPSLRNIDYSFASPSLLHRNPVSPPQPRPCAPQHGPPPRISPCASAAAAPEGGRRWVALRAWGSLHQRYCSAARGAAGVPRAADRVLPARGGVAARGEVLRY